MLDCPMMVQVIVFFIKETLPKMKRSCVCCTGPTQSIHLYSSTSCMLMLF